MEVCFACVFLSHDMLMSTYSTFRTNLRKQPTVCDTTTVSCKMMSTYSRYLYPLKNVKKNEKLFKLFWY